MGSGTSLRDLVPAPIVNLARRGRRYWRRLQYFRSRLTPSRVVTAEAIQGALIQLGITEGDDIFLHSSMRAFGAIDGGTDAVLRAITQVIGPTGTLLVPVYPGTGSNYAHLDAGGVALDAATSPSRMGKITETVRLSPGARRSLHPTHSVAAVGPAASYYVEGHRDSVTPCGPNSPFTKLIERKAWIVCLGSPIGRVTSYHVIEDRAPSFPHDVYAPRVFTVKVIDASGQIHEVQARCHAPRLSPGRIDNNPRKEQEFHGHLTSMGVLRQLQAGPGVISVMRADMLEAALEDLLQRGITIYDPSVGDSGRTSVGA